MPQLLGTIKSAELESLTLDIFLDKAEDLDDFDWERARAALAPQRLPQLRSLDFVVRGKALSVDGATAALAERLPEWAKRGVLSVQGHVGRSA